MTAAGKAFVVWRLVTLTLEMSLLVSALELEDAASGFRRRKLAWVLIGDATMTLKERCAAGDPNASFLFVTRCIRKWIEVVAWSCFLFMASWWLFSFHFFELLQAFI